MTAIERFFCFLEKQGLKHTPIEKSLGLSNGYLGKMKAKNASIGSDILEKIFSFFPDLSVEWLVTGKGSMLEIDNSIIYNDDQNKELQARPSKEGIPLIPLDAIAGFSDSGLTTVMEYECERYVIPNFRGAEFLIQVKGSSMYPKYSSGDIVACKKLPLDTFFQWNKVYVLDTEQGVLIKRIKPAENKDHIICVSDNEKYDPFELHKKGILSVSIVIGVIRLE